MKTVILSDVCDISSGGTPSRSNPEYFRGHIPWAKISDIENAENGVVFKTEEFISADGLKNIRGKIFPKGTLLFAMYGSIGKTAIAGKELSTNQAILGIRPKSENDVRISYLKSWFECNKQKLINQGRGVALKNLSATIVRNLEIELPPLNDQIRIAHLLDKVEGLIAQRKQHLQQLDELLKSVFLEMFGDPVRNEKGWEVFSFRELFAVPPRIGTTKPASSDTGIPVVRVGELGGLEVRFDKCAIVELSTDEYVKCKVEVGDILLARAIGSKEQLGKASLITELKRLIAFDSHVMRLRFDPVRVDPFFAYFWLRSSGGRALFLKASRETSVQFNINTTQISSIRIPLPPQSLQEEFAIIVKRIGVLASHYQQTFTNLETLYAALSQQAFKGELDLSRIDQASQRLD
jgi:type I restriction enzyme S subunit